MKISVIIPTLNEEKYLPRLLESIRNQGSNDVEIIIVDGGSTDRTQEIARSYNSNLILLPKVREFPSMNHGARVATSDLLVFTGADTIFERNILQKISDRFQNDPELIAATGFRKLIEAPLIARIEYNLLEILKRIVISMPRRFRKFPASTSFLIVRKEAFDQIGGFTDNNVNADGEFGAKINNIGKVAYFSDIFLLISGRRIVKMGFVEFNIHMWYAWENFFPFLSPLFKARKKKSLENHSMMRKEASY